MMRKKGLSDVITTVLIILLSLVAVAIISGVIVKYVQKGSGQIGEFGNCNKVDVLPQRCVISGNDVQVSIKRGGASNGQPISSIDLIFLQNGESTHVAAPGIPAVLETLPQTVTLTPAPTRVSLAVKLTDAASGKEATCPETVSIACESGTLTRTCGNGVAEPGEACGEPGLAACGTGRNCVSCQCTTPPPGPANIPPTMSGAGIFVNVSYVAPAASIPIRAMASDSDGNIAKIEFFSNGVKIGENSTFATGIGYIYTMTNVAGGVYSITARATDNSGDTSSYTAPAIVTVGYRLNMTIGSQYTVYENNDEGNDPLLPPYCDAAELPQDVTQHAACLSVHAPGSTKYYTINWYDNGVSSNWNWNWAPINQCTSVYTANGKWVCMITMDSHKTIIVNND